MTLQNNYTLNRYNVLKVRVKLKFARKFNGHNKKKKS